MEHETAYIEDIIFMNKQNIPWSDVERYLKKYIIVNIKKEASKPLEPK